MYHFEITRNKKEEFVLGLKSTKNGELIFKTEGYATKAHAKKMATKITGLTEETEIRDMTVLPKVDKKAAKAPAPAAKKPKAKSAEAEK